MIKAKSSRAAEEARYERAAQRYMASLPLEHYMESTPHAKQREITLASLALLTAARPDVHVFNELLVLYPLAGSKKLGNVVPDNMVVIHAGPIKANLSYNLPLLKARPFWVLEYVSANSTRKDYVDNMRHYEHALKVPYYLLFDPNEQIVTLFHHDGERFVALKPNAHGRLEVPELDLEMALLNDWVRFWHEGKLLPLPAEMQNELGALTRRAEAAERELAQLREQVKTTRSKKNGAN